MLKIRRIHSYPDLIELKNDWDRLAAGVPFRSFVWLTQWWKQYDTPSCTLYVLVVEDPDQGIIGIAPWYLDSGTTWGRVIRSLGGGEVCSDYLGLLTTQVDADIVAEAIADWLTDDAFDESGSDNLCHGWDLLHLDGIDTNDVSIAPLVSHLWTRGNKVHRDPGLRTWRIELPDSWDDYVGMLSKSHRKQVRRVLKRQLEAGKAELKTVTCAAELPRGMKILVDLHQRRRLSLGEPGCFASLRFSEFLHHAAIDLLEADRLRLHWVEIEGQPAAAEFHLVDNGVVYAYQAGINPDMMDAEPGRLINIATLRYAIEQGYTAFDFLRGDEPYKAHWRAEPRESLELRIVPQRALAQIRHGVWLAGDNVKHWVRTGLELAGMR